MRSIQCLKLLRCQCQCQRDGVLLYMRYGTGFGNCNDVTAADGPGQRNSGCRATVCCANTRKRGITQQTSAGAAEWRDSALSARGKDKTGYLFGGRRFWSWMRSRPGRFSLPFRALPRMGQNEEPGCVGSDAGGRGGLELSRCPNNPEHDCRYEAHGK